MTEQPLTTRLVTKDYGTHNFEGGLSEMIAWFRARLEDIPAEYRASATADFHSDEDGDPYVSINYRRPETPQEQVTRLHREDLVRRREIATLKQLQAKYGKDIPE